MLHGNYYQEVNTLREMLTSSYTVFLPIIILFTLFLFFFLVKQITLLKSLLLSFLLLVAIWLNAPFFLGNAILQESISEGLFSWPCTVSQKEDWLVYYVLANAVLVVASYYVDRFMNKKYYSHSEVKKKYDAFVADATQLYVIGRDIDFLNKKEYKIQSDHIKGLHNRSELLCEKTNDRDLLKLYQSVTEESGVGIRFYQKNDSLTNLKGQIKIDQSGNLKALFISRKGTRYTVIEMEHNFLVHAILDRFNQVYEQAEPVK